MKIAAKLLLLTLIAAMLYCLLPQQQLIERHTEIREAREEALGRWHTN